MAVSATSSLAGVNGVGPIAGGRAVRAPDPAATDENLVVVDSGASSEAAATGAGPTDANTASFAANSFAAQPEYQAAIFAANAPSPRAVAAAYRTASAVQGAAETSGTASDVELPNLPARLSSGRVLDLSV